MKKLLTLLLGTLFILTACNKDDEAPQPEPQIAEIDKLPPATQTGANKVGCLVNGKAFLPKGSYPGGGNPNPYCAYYHDAFVLSFSIVRNENNTSMEGTESIAIHSSNVILEESKTYSLKINDQRAGYLITKRSPKSDRYDTTEEQVGEFHITKLDKEKNIISGTFWFDAVNEQGKKVEIREGRFDMVFEGWAGKV